MPRDDAALLVAFELDLEFSVPDAEVDAQIRWQVLLVGDAHVDPGGQLFLDDAPIRLPPQFLGDLAADDEDAPEGHLAGLGQFPQPVPNLGLIVTSVRGEPEVERMEGRAEHVPLEGPHQVRSQRGRAAPENDVAGLQGPGGLPEQVIHHSEQRDRDVGDGLVNPIDGVGEIAALPGTAAKVGQRGGKTILFG
nr:hypothetical protein [Stackebrandtia nassauensis]